MIPHVLIVDADEHSRGRAAGIVVNSGYACATVGCAGEGLARLEREPFAVTLVDADLPDMAGHEFISHAVRRFDTVCLAQAENPGTDNVVQTLREFRAFDYLVKPYDEDTLRLAVQRAFENYEILRLTRVLPEVERSFYEDALRMFNWRQEIRRKTEEYLASTVIHQLNIGFFHGSGVGALMSAMSILFSQAEKNAEGNVQIAGPLFDLAKENYETSLSVIRSLSDAQAILMESRPAESREDGSGLYEFLDELRRDLRPMLELKKQHIDLGCPGGVADRRTFPFDREKMHILFEELLINAMKYSMEGDTIFLLAVGRGDFLEFKVMNPARDAICRPIQGREEGLVFEPFYRLQADMDDRYTMERFGHGLGLAVVKKIVESHGGSVFLHTIQNHLRAEGGNDVCITVRIPLSED